MVRLDKKRNLIKRSLYSAKRQVGIVVSRGGNALGQTGTSHTLSQIRNKIPAFFLLVSSIQLTRWTVSSHSVVITF